DRLHPVGYAVLVGEQSDIARRLLGRGEDGRLAERLLLDLDMTRRGLGDGGERGEKTRDEKVAGEADHEVALSRARFGLIEISEVTSIRICGRPRPPG